jgi:hypothetical protein
LITVLKQIVCRLNNTFGSTIFRNKNSSKLWFLESNGYRQWMSTPLEITLLSEATIASCAGLI